MTTTLPTSILTKKQVKTYGPRIYTENGRTMKILAKVRYDDECGNGRNSFAITCDMYEKAKNGRWVDAGGGAAHDEIAKHFPELAPYIKWHLTSSDGPMYYIDNTLYHAKSHGPTHAFVYFDDPEHGVKKRLVKYCTLEEAHDMCLAPGNTFNYVSGIGYRLEKDEKTSKTANLNVARSSAIWPEATDEELCLPPDELKAELEARLPKLMEEFKAAVESLGFVY